MDIIIVCHTEFGFVHNKQIIGDKSAIEGVTDGVKNLIDVTDKYGAKVTFAVCPEVVEHFPKATNHEIGLHIHPGWERFDVQGISYYVGDKYLREHCKQSSDSTVLKSYSYKEQFDMIKVGKDCLHKAFGVEPKAFVAGRWSINNDTVMALIEAGITHECSAAAHTRAEHYDWMRLPRICMPYNPSRLDYQKKGDLPLLIVPISQMIRFESVNPEAIPRVGLPWLKACFSEYYIQKLPLFHICLHSPCMTDSYFISSMDNLLQFISKHKNIHFRFASEIKKYNYCKTKTLVFPYLLAINRNIIFTYLQQKIYGK